MVVDKKALGCFSCSPTDTCSPITFDLTEIKKIYTFYCHDSIQCYHQSCQNRKKKIIFFSKCLQQNSNFPKKSDF